MKLIEVDRNQLWTTADGEFVVKAGISAKPGPDNSIRFTIYHVYNKQGFYIGQAKDREGDFVRVIREYNTKTKKPK